MVQNQNLFYYHISDLMLSVLKLFTALRKYLTKIWKFKYGGGGGGVVEGGGCEKINLATQASISAVNQRKEICLCVYQRWSVRRALSRRTVRVRWPSSVTSFVDPPRTRPCVLNRCATPPCVCARMDYTGRVADAFPKRTVDASRVLRTDTSRSSPILFSPFIQRGEKTLYEMFHPSRINATVPLVEIYKQGRFARTEKFHQISYVSICFYF